MLEPVSVLSILLQIQAASNSSKLDAELFPNPVPSGVSPTASSLEDDEIFRCDGPLLLMPYDLLYKFAEDNLPPTIWEFVYDAEREDWGMHFTEQDAATLRKMYHEDCKGHSFSQDAASSSCSAFAAGNVPAAACGVVLPTSAAGKAKMGVRENMLEMDEAGKMLLLEEARSGQQELELRMAKDVAAAEELDAVGHERDDAAAGAAVRLSHRRFPPDH